MPITFEQGSVRSDADAQELLRKIRSDPRGENPRVLAINQLLQMQAKNGGYPVHMYHETLNAVVVNDEKEEEAMSQAGFRKQYKFKQYPRYMFRRNMHPKFHKSPLEKIRIQGLSPDAQRIEMATTNEQDYIEERVVKDAMEEVALLKQGPNKAAGIGQWVNTIQEIEPWQEDAVEDPAVTIARLEGEVQALRDKRKKQEQPAA